MSFMLRGIEAESSIECKLVLHTKKRSDLPPAPSFVTALKAESLDFSKDSTKLPMLAIQFSLSSQLYETR